MNSIGFHTPELPAPLGIDLAKLRGGGACPSQFFGETHEGLSVYVRYRNGWIGVYIGNEPGVETFGGGRCILESGIGPPLDGAMSLTQFCTNFGVTVNGRIPDETDTDAHRYKDLTGRTTYWGANLNEVTIETARNILASACSSLPNALLVKALTDDEFKSKRLELTSPRQVDVFNVWLIDGPSSLAEIESGPGDYVLPKTGQLTIAIHYSPWRYPGPRYEKHADRAERELGRPVIVAGDRKMPKEFELTTDFIMLRTHFSKEDHLKRDALTKLSEAISAHLPVTKLERVELATGNSIGTFDRPIDPVIVDWCNSGPDRWVGIEGGRPNTHWIGVRPARQ